MIAKNITNSVPTAVWIATLIKTYENLVLKGINEYWISQKKIQEIARLLCPKNIDNARISQWCNGDHPNNTYNYLRAKGSLRRLTKIGEFSTKEQPKEIPINELIFEKNNIRLIDIIKWYNDEYCSIEFENSESEIENTKVNKNKYYTIKEDKEIKRNIGDKQNKLINEELFESHNIKIRSLALIKIAWEVFSRKVGNGLIIINKEASMQLQYAHILKHMLPLIIFEDDENIDIELETTVSDGTRNREVDIMLIVNKGSEVYKIALELKCYRTKTSSGGNRGATDIFMKDVYQDINSLELYCENEQADLGIFLVMNDHENFINPKNKNAKCWHYDISQGTIVDKIHLTTPIGGKDIDITINNKYEFKWTHIGEFWFLLLMTD